MRTLAIILIILGEVLFIMVMSSGLCAAPSYSTPGNPLFTTSSKLDSKTNTEIDFPRILQKCSREFGAIIRGDKNNKSLSIIFTGGDFADGGSTIRKILKAEHMLASFFFTGDFYRKPSNRDLVYGLIADGHYLGPHSDKHLLYCSWEDRKNTLVSQQEFIEDIQGNYEAMARFGIEKEKAIYFVPPFEWYNATIAGWMKELGLILINFTPGTLSNSDYTTPGMANYKSSDLIYSSIIDYEKTSPQGLNGFILLLHIGTHPDRKDKFYDRLSKLINYLRQRDYTLLRVDHLLKNCVHMKDH